MFCFEFFDCIHYDNKTVQLIYLKNFDVFFFFKTKSLQLFFYYRTRKRLTLPISFGKRLVKVQVLKYLDSWFNHKSSCYKIYKWYLIF